MQEFSEKIPTWNEETTNDLLDELEKFSGDFFKKLEDYTKKIVVQRYESKEAELIIKQNFQTLLSMTDKKFMEHVVPKITLESGSAYK